MSVTFSVRGSRITYQPCPECGHELGYQGIAGGEMGYTDCSKCSGYGGGDEISTHPYLNLCNRNACVLIDLLNIKVEDEIYGEVTPEELRQKVASARVFASAATRPTRDNQGIEIDDNGVRPSCRVIEFGLELDQIIYYLDTLNKIIDAADGQMIIFD